MRIVVAAGKPSKGVYLVFHASGYTSYEAEHCYTTHSVDKYAADFVRNLKGIVQFDVIINV